MIEGSSVEPELFQRAVVCHFHNDSHSGPRIDRVVQCAIRTLQAGRLPSAKEDGYVGSAVVLWFTDINNGFCGLLHKCNTL